MLFKNRDGHGFSMAFGPQFKRFNNSLRRGSKRFSSTRRAPRPSSVMSNPDLHKNENDASTTSSKLDAAQGWAASFERLLDDPEGVKAFAEFLKMEFSSENIDFWTSVERFRRMPNGPEKKTEARRIYQQHVCVGAPEAVNVDAQGRQCAQQALQEAPSNIFDQAQKQVLNLMKFDSYPRFLKSDLYKQCVSQATTTTSKTTPTSIATPSKLKKSLSNAEDRRRKSLLPWHRKSQSKSKERQENGGNGDESKNEIHSSRSSLTSLDLAIAAGNLQNDSDSFSGAVLCRVTLGNSSTTVVQIKPKETVQELAQRLLEKRGLNYTSFEVFTDRHTKPVDPIEASVVLAGCEVKIQQRVVFKLDLPNRKTVSVKSKATKMIIEVLKPILHKYDFQVDQVFLQNPKDGCVVDIKQPITVIDGLKLQVQLIDKKTTTVPEPKFANALKTNKLVEITNQVFETILQEKSDTSQSKPKSDKGSIKSEDLGSEHSNYFGKFLRRDSTQQDWKKKSLIPRSKFLASAKISTTPEQNQFKNKPLIAKWKAGVNKLQVSSCSESECNELVEGLTRAQKSRLEDQRGTEINFELPDFLKDKENDRKTRKSQQFDETKTTTSNYENQCVLNTDKTEKNNEDLSPVNTPNKQMKMNNTRIFSSQKLRPEFRGLEPPPLPPKPKIVPLKPPNWGNEYSKTKQSLFLEQPSSSFV